LLLFIPLHCSLFSTNNQQPISSLSSPAALGLGLLLAPDAGCFFCLSWSAVHCLLFFTPVFLVVLLGGCSCC
jgi:hypothetical protein